MLAVVHHSLSERHVAPRGHPERPERLSAALEALTRPEFDGAVIHLDAPRAPRSALLTVHDEALVAGLEERAGTAAMLDPDTYMSPGSWEAAERAAGAGLAAVEVLDAAEASAAFCLVRPPGHHATPQRAMGFCLLNNVAVTARRLQARGERVAIVDIDAHHGNGTQDVFWSDPDVLFVSWHESPAYPGTGRADEVGAPGAEGATVNLPLPSGATGDVYLDSIQSLVGEALDRFEPTWLLVSAGFDAHRRDPLCGLALSSGDFGRIVSTLMTAVPAGRRLLFLEGGYDLGALTDSVAATAGALLGTDTASEPPTAGGPGGDVAAAVAAHLRG